MKRVVIAALFATWVVVWCLSGFQQYLTIDWLKSEQAQIAGIYAAHPGVVIGAYFAIYVVLSALSVPGAAVLTIGAGALFGVFVGTAVVSFAAAIGATLAFWTSRTFLRDWAQKRFAGKIDAINLGIERDGARYLFSLRLVPAFPFFAVNLLMGLTSLPTWTFYWVSQLGMLLGTVFYVNAGSQLGRIVSLSDVVSPGLLCSFVALGAVPWIGKWLTNLLKRRRLYSRWSRPTKFDRNLVVIGAGAAGLVSSYIAATVRAKVTLVEASRMGGDCLNYGCVPSKALIKSAKIAHQMRHADAYGLAGNEPSFNFRAVMQRIHGVIAAIEPHDSVARYTGLGVDVVKGYATIIDPWTVEVACSDGRLQRLTTRSIIIAAGAAPIVPPIPGIDESGYLTSDTLWEEFAKLDEIPRRIVVLGGGPIGSELSQAFARLGAEISQVQSGPRLLPREDADVSAVARAAQEAAGVRVLTDHQAIRFEMRGTQRIVVLRHQNEERDLPYDALIVAVGRKARLTGYGLEDIGVDTERTVVTDEYLATLYPNIYAAGDVVGPFQLTHAAAHQAWFASVNALFGQFKRFKADYRVIPWTTFIDPEVARVGLNEQEARAQGIDYEVTTYPMHELDRAIADSATQGFVKVLTPPGKDRILGATIVGEHAGELIAEYVLAMKHGLGLNKILGTIHTYPTMAEANKYAAGEWKKKHAPDRLLRMVERYHAWRRG